MIKTHSMIMDELKEYGNPKTRLGRMVRGGQYTPVIRGLYETDAETPGYLLAGSIYGPSYLSFDFALSYYGMIPESVHTYTSATFDKKKKRAYNTPFGHFTYRDVPTFVYPIGVTIKEEGGYAFQIATREKALCDKLYTLKPAGNQEELRTLLTEYLRIDMSEIMTLDDGVMKVLEECYHSTNVSLLYRIFRKEKKRA